MLNTKAATTNTTRTTIIATAEDKKAEEDAKRTKMKRAEQKAGKAGDSLYNARIYE